MSSRLGLGYGSTTRGHFFHKMDKIAKNWSQFSDQPQTNTKSPQESNRPDDCITVLKLLEHLRQLMRPSQVLAEAMLICFCAASCFELTCKSALWSSSSGKLVQFQQRWQWTQYWLISSFSPLTCFLTAHFLPHPRHVLNSSMRHFSSTTNSVGLMESKETSNQNDGLSFSTTLAINIMRLDVYTKEI